MDTEDTGESQESQAGDSQEAEMAGESQEGESAKKKRKKDKKHKTGVKNMMKKERQRKSEELKAQRKERALEKKRAKEEAAKEKARLKREEHRLLKKTQALLRKNPPAATMVRAEDEQTATEVEVHPEPPRERQIEDPLETSLVEPGPPLVSLNPFEGEDEPVIRPTSGTQPGAAAILTETIHEENIGEPSQKLQEVHQRRQWEKCQENKKTLKRRTGRPQVPEP